MLSWLHRNMAERSDRKGKRRLQHLTALLNDGRCDESKAKIFVSDLTSLVRRYANQLATEDLQKLVNLSASAYGIVGYDSSCPQDGYCNVSSDSAHVGPCLHSTNPAPIYDSIPIECQEIIAEARQELERRAAN